MIDLIKVNPALNPDLDLATDRRGPVCTAALEKVRDSAANLLKALETEDGRLPKRVQLSKFRRVPEDLVFKICSKLVHPTSVSILTLPNETESQLEARRVHFRSLSLFYAKAGLDALLAVVKMRA